MIRTLLLAALLASAPDSALVATARVGFTGSSTLHDFEGTAAPVTFALAPTEAGRWSAEVEVPVASLDTENEWRDQNLRAMFDAPRFPVVRARFAAVDPEALRVGRPLSFVLEIRDVARAVTADVSDWDEDAEGAAFEAQFTVSLREFGLAPPSALGVIEVGDEVRVRVRVEVRRA